ncbi:MAG: FAD-dependent oxidoreductase [Desulfobacterales bacterium]
MLNHYDVIVVGAGSAGIAAAVCSVRNGARTLLLEKDSVHGGLAVRGNLPTICGLFMQVPGSAPEFLYDGFPCEVALKLMKHDSVAAPVKMGRVHVLPCRPGTFQKVSTDLLAAEKNLQVLYNVRIRNVHVHENCIHKIDLTEKKTQHCIETDAVIDCTGEAVVCHMAGLETIPEEECSQVPAILFSMDTTGGIFFSRSNMMNMLVRIKRAVDSGGLPQGADAVSFVPEVGGDALIVKLNLGVFLRPDQKIDEKELEKKANELKQELSAFLLKNIEGFDQSSSFSAISPVLKRTGRRARGSYVLTGKDVLTGARFPDAAARGCWPVEKYHFLRGYQVSYPPDGTCYEIPARSLTVSGVDNLFVAGKCISADDDAIASARVIGCCLATGESSAKLASQKVCCV